MKCLGSSFAQNSFSLTCISSSLRLLQDKRAILKRSQCWVIGIKEMCFTKSTICSFKTASWKDWYEKVQHLSSSSSGALSDGFWGFLQCLPSLSSVPTLLSSHWYTLEHSHSKWITNVPLWGCCVSNRTVVQPSSSVPWKTRFNRI